MCMIEDCDLVCYLCVRNWWVSYFVLNMVLNQFVCCWVFGFSARGVQHSPVALCLVHPEHETSAKHPTSGILEVIWPLGR